MKTRAKGWLWIAAVVGLLGSSVALYATVIIVSVSDPSFALEPDYEETAANWDAHRAAEVASDRLGWTHALRVEPRPGGRDADVSLWIHDRWGKPVKAERVTIEMFHSARGNRVLAAEMHPADAGLFVATLPVRRPGVWQIAVRAERDGDVFLETTRVSVGRGAPG